MIATTPEIDNLLASDSPVAIGVSGGKDSTAAAFATVRHLDEIGHAGPRLLIHSDLGRVEWKDSLPTCERLSARLGLELVNVPTWGEAGQMAWVRRNVGALVGLDVRYTDAASIIDRHQELMYAQDNKRVRRA